jgi:serine O-acetyltransferase
VKGLNGEAQGAREGIDGLVEAMIASYRGDARGQHINKKYMPSREAIVEVIHLLLAVFYPGYHGRQDLTDENLAWHVGATLVTLRDKLSHQIELCLCYRSESGEHTAPDLPRCRQHGRDVAMEFLRRLPAIRGALLLDVQAAYDGDPAASGFDEVIMAYPGLLAVTVYRVAHELHVLGVPLMPRIMTEWAHTQTGADIHPGAVLGESFFIDHATGVVVGGTAHIGARVKLYQGVTLGALSFPKDEAGRVIRGTKRHPTVEDDVTLYANATVLGGATTVGRGSVVGGSVFITKSVPPGHQVALEAPKLRVVTARPAITSGSNPPPTVFEIEFEI